MTYHYPNARKLWYKNTTMTASSYWMKTWGRLIASSTKKNYSKENDSLCARYVGTVTGPRPDLGTFLMTHVFYPRVSGGPQKVVFHLKHPWNQWSHRGPKGQPLGALSHGETAGSGYGRRRPQPDVTASPAAGSPHTAATGLTLARRRPVEAHDAVDPLLRVHQQLPPPQLGSALGGREAGGDPRGRGRRSRPAAVLHPRQNRPRRYLSAAQWGRPTSARRRQSRPPLKPAPPSRVRAGERGEARGEPPRAPRSPTGRRPHWRWPLRIRKWHHGVRGGKGARAEAAAAGSWLTGAGAVRVCVAAGKANQQGGGFRRGALALASSCLSLLKILLSVNLGNPPCVHWGKSA